MNPQLSPGAIDYITSYLLEDPEIVAAVLNHYIPGVTTEQVEKARDYIIANADPFARVGYTVFPGEHAYLEAMYETSQRTASRMGKARMATAVSARTLRKFSNMSQVKPIISRSPNRAWTVEQDYALAILGEKVRGEVPDSTRLTRLSRTLPHTLQPQPVEPEPVAEQPAVEQPAPVEQDAPDATLRVTDTLNVEVFTDARQVAFTGHLDRLSAEDAERLATTLGIAARLFA